MRIGVISDVHGNLLALDAAQKALSADRVDMVVNLGDLCSGGVEPGATAWQLRRLDHLVIRGNHERQLLENPIAQLGLSDQLARQELSAEDLEWMASLPTRLQPVPGVTAFHGSPRSDLEYLLETVEPTGARPATEEEIVERLGADIVAEVILCGHTHLPRIVRLDEGPLIVNPGSVGWPAYADDLPYLHVMESGSPEARYAIVERETSGWTAELHTINYDWEAAAQIAEGNGRPDIAYSLRTGLAPE
ncbi:MAG: metallophosphatase family protein [Propionibacteriaceae bacterium]|jgi:predicted phosphodiesterase|nr:metallophosphatase family protein [Propionibacteriaceae bacterium]